VVSRIILDNHIPWRPLTRLARLATVFTKGGEGLSKTERDRE
jgi:hypothetical protein